ncbi:MAG: hypothetical protein M0Z28_32220 [Rhodospirillales bacterium]|nr:hypothetical protein [Rhodospirillales bacterium]
MARLELDQPGGRIMEVSIRRTILDRDAGGRWVTTGIIERGAVVVRLTDGRAAAAF